MAFSCGSQDVISNATIGNNCTMVDDKMEIILATYILGIADQPERHDKIQSSAHQCYFRDFMIHEQIAAVDFDLNINISD